MRMRIFLALILTLGLAAGGCAWFSGESATSAETTASQTQEQAVAPEPAPAQEAPAKSPASKAKAEKAAKKAPAAKASKGAKSEEEIRASLEVVGRKLAAQASRTVMPSKAAKEVRKDGNGFVATYVEVDAQNVTTELRPGAKGQYVGFIRYQEKIYECRGASKQAALSAPCQQTRARRLNELIRYDGRSWQY